MCPCGKEIKIWFNFKLCDRCLEVFTNRMKLGELAVTFFDEVEIEVLSADQLEEIWNL